MSKVICSVSSCAYNDGKGNCGLDEVYISDAETGNPMCEDAELGEE